MVGEHVAHHGTMTTGINFGADGALYLADWGNNGWAPHEKGRIMKLDALGATDHPLRKQTRKLLGEGFTSAPCRTGRAPAHADQRVRLEAQFELAKRNEADALLAVAKKNDPNCPRPRHLGAGSIGPQIPSRSPAACRCFATTTRKSRHKCRASLPTPITRASPLKRKIYSTRRTPRAAVRRDGAGQDRFQKTRAGRHSLSRNQ